MNGAHMAEFASDPIEPSRAEIDFSLLGRTIETPAERGINTMLCTPTAASAGSLATGHPQLSNHQPLP
jgi:beta-galactosidase